MRKKILLIFIMISVFYNIAYTFENKILFKVDNEIITSIDILNEINYLNSINEEFKNFEKEKVYEVAKNSLIREKVKEIFLTKVYEDIKLNDKDFNKLILGNYSYLKINDIEGLGIYLKKYGLNLLDLKKKISIKTLWSQYIYSKYSKNININIEELKKEILKNDKQKEFLVSEILFNLENSETLDKKFSLIDKAIRKDGFQKSALIYSMSESSSNGGKIGWIKEKSINSKILEYISNLKINEHTKPIVVPGGFLILKVDEVKETTREIELDQELETIIRAKTNNQLNQFSNIFLSKIKKEVTINEL